VSIFKLQGWGKFWPNLIFGGGRGIDVDVDVNME